MNTTPFCSHDSALLWNNDISKELGAGQFVNCNIANDDVYGSERVTISPAQLRKLGNVSSRVRASLCKHRKERNSMLDSLENRSSLLTRIAEF